MILNFFDEDDNPVIEFDEDGIEYLERGLAQARGLEDGEQIVAPTLVSAPDGAPVGVGELTLRRVAE